MMSLVYLAAALFLGAAIVRRLGLRLYTFELPALIIVLGLVIWTWMSFLLALALPIGLGLILATALALGAGAWLWHTAPAWQIAPWPSGPASRRGWIIFTIAAAMLFGTLMLSHDLPLEPTGIYSANSTWADFGLHASLISHFNASDHWSWDFPVAAGTKMTYPFMVDLLSAWLQRGGWNLQMAIFVPSILLILSFLQLMIGFGARLFKGRIGGALVGLTLMLFSGTAVGLFTAWSDWQHSGLSLGTFLAQIPKDYTALTVPNAQVNNFITDLMLPQRAFLLGIALFAAVLILFTQLRRRPSTRLAIFAGALIGLLPLIHAHTFLVLGILTLGLWLEALITKRQLFNTWFFTGATALLVALPQLIWQNRANGTGTGGHLALGWLINPGESLLSFWAHNFGLTLILMIAIALVLYRARSLRRYLTWYLPFLAVFALANIYSLQPFTYDNLKLIAYVYLITYLFAGYGLVWLVRRQHALLAPLLLLVLIMSGSGVLAIMREFEHHDQFASLDDIALADWAKASTAPNDVFFTTDRPNQPLATLAGRSLVAGYRGWLYNYNLDYTPRLEAISAALNAQATTDNPYHARYVAVGTYESPDWTINRSALQSAYQVVYSNPSWTVYRLP